MGRPRIHPRKLYRATETGFYIDQETGDELTYFAYQTILPDTAFENIPLGRQEKMAKKLVGFGVFERLDGDPEEIERVSGEPTSIREEVN